MSHEHQQTYYMIDPYWGPYTGLRFRVEDSVNGKKKKHQIKYSSAETGYKSSCDMVTKLRNLSTNR